MKSFFFAELSDYKDLTPVEINQQNFQIFYFTSSLNLLLDMTSINEHYKTKVEFSSSIKTFEIYGYETDDYNAIENTSGEKMPKLDETTSAFYIYKDKLGLL